MTRLTGNVWKLITCVLTVLFCVLYVSADVRAEENLKIRVGFFDMHGFQELDEHGHYYGYNVDYLNVMAKRAEWEIEYVPVGDFTAGIEALRNKEIDLLAPCDMQVERSAEFLYSKYSFGTDYYVLIVNSKESRMIYEDVSNIDGMRVAAVKDYPLTEEFIEYAEKNNISPELVYFDTVEESLEALDRGEVEGAITSLMMVEEKHKIIVEYSSAPFYYMTYMENEDMMYHIDDMMNYIASIYPQMVEDLQQKHYPMYSEKHFTVEEQKFIENSDTIKVGYMDYYSPVSFRNSKGELDGISRVIFDEIQRITGLKFEYVPLTKGDITYEYLVKNEIQVVTGVTNNTRNISSEYMILSIPYFWSKKVFVGKDIVEFDHNAEKKVAVISGSQTIGDIIKEEYPNFEIVRFDDVKDCFRAVNDGDADYVFINQAVANDMLLRPEFRFLEIIPAEGQEDALCFAAVEINDEKFAYNDKERKLLIQVIDKAISIIGKDELNGYVVEETMRHKYDYTIFDYLYMYRYLVIALAVVLVLCVVICYYYLKHRIERRKRNIKIAEERIIAQRRYEAVLNNSDVIIYELSMRDKSVMVSECFKKKFGWMLPDEIEDFTGVYVAEVFRIHPEDRPKMYDTYYFKKEYSEGDNAVLIRIADKVGDYIWCNVTRIPIFDSNDEIVSVVGKIEDVSEQIKEKQILEEKARKDGLSGLLNKVTFKEEVEEYLREHSSYFSAMIFVDMDKFKEINDNFGHNIGDVVIRDVAEKLGLVFSNIDLVSRFGGDEFCVFVKNIPPATLMNKIEWAVEKLKASYESDSGIANVTASIGVAYCKCNDATYETMVKMADDAVYEVKNNGRDSYSIKEIV